MKTQMEGGYINEGKSFSFIQIWIIYWIKMHFVLNIYL